MIDREAAHASLDAVLDALERAEQANDPEANRSAESEVHELWQALSRQLVGKVYGSRLGAAALGRPVDHPTVAGEGAARVGGEGWDDADLGDEQDRRQSAQRMLAQFTSDFSILLPRSIASLATTDFRRLSLGVPALWMTKRRAGSRLSKKSSLESIINHALLCRIYYLSGYESTAVEKIGPRETGEADTYFTVRSWDSLIKERQKLGLTRICSEWQQRGREDASLGRPITYPIGAAGTIDELVRLRKAQ